MTNQYAKLTASELEYGEKSLLQSQLELLDSMKEAQAYRKLRKEEVHLKIEFKRKIAEMQEAIKEFEKCLPEVEEEKSIKEKPKIPMHEIHELQHGKEVKKDIKLIETEENPEDVLSRHTIEHEIEEIRKKLHALG